jgi:SNF2 family DNA or RNA helicase
VEFLRQFRFGYAAIDEAHRIKGDTGRNKTVMSLIPGIKKLRLASGTFCHDSPSDLARVVGSMDPTIFGTRAEFNEEFGDIVRGERVARWKEGAQRLIMARIRQHVVVASAMRKEWAAFLPVKHEWVGARNLTEAQQAVYESILNEVEDNIREAAKTNPILRQFLERMERKKEQTEEDGPDLDDADMDLAGMLNPYLARLESFLVSTGRDELGSKLL